MPNLAIVGAGIMGANHGRVAGSIREFTVTAVCDPDLERAAAMAKPHDALATSEPRRGHRRAPTPSILATPSDTHADTRHAHPQERPRPAGREADRDHGRRRRALIEAAEANDRILMVGHVERFNPAVTELMRLVDEPVALEITRVGPFTGRVLADVVLDLMIHDIDLARAIARSRGRRRAQRWPRGALRRHRPRLRAAAVRQRRDRQHHREPGQPEQDPADQRSPSARTRSSSTCCASTSRCTGSSTRSSCPTVAPATGRAASSRSRSSPSTASRSMHELRHFAACVQDRPDAAESTAHDGLAALEVASPSGTSSSRGSRRVQGPQDRGRGARVQREQAHRQDHHDDARLRRPHRRGQRQVHRRHLRSRPGRSATRGWS